MSVNAAQRTERQLVYCGYDESQESWGLQVTGAGTSPCTGSGVRVAVLDTGAALSHPHLASRIRDARSFVPNESAEDRNGHGTACCGILCGPRGYHDGIAGYGVAPAGDLYVGKVLNDANRAGRFVGVVHGIEWALEHGCRVICLALGDCHLTCQSDPAFEALARAALDSGVLIVAAAGNTSNRFGDRVDPVLFPASSESVLAVASVTGRLTIDLSSNAGGIGAAAPGQAILSAALNGGMGYSNGTSMAAAFVAGIAALWLEAHPRLDGTQLWNVLLRTAQRLEGLSRADVGAGLARAPQQHGFNGEG